MKILTLFILILLGISSSLTSQQCLPYGIIFSTQEEIDNFQTNYPNCNEIEGNVKISDQGTDNISNLIGLNVITSIGGDLVIRENNLLTNLEGLENLSHIGGLFNIYTNYNLSNISSLESLAFIGGDLFLVHNYGLTSVDGFSNLTQVSGGIQIVACPLLQNLTGFSNLSILDGLLLINNNPNLKLINGFEDINTIHGSLVIANNPSLQSINSFNNISSIAGDLYISDNDSLASIRELINVTRIYGNIYIQGNPKLTSLEGLDNITPSLIQIINISNNQSLSYCEVNSICEFLSDSLGNAYIESNTSGCNSKFEVIENCVVGLNNNYLSRITIYPNPCEATFNLTYDKNINIADVFIFDSFGKKVYNKEYQSEPINVSYLSSGIYIIEIHSEISIMRKKLFIK